MQITWLLAFALAATPARAGDLKKVMAEPNLEKRSKAALDNAAASYKELRAAYDKGEGEKVALAVTEIGESVDLAQTSLNQTGKVPRRSPKYFKAAEIATRDLLRKLENFQQEMGFEDRSSLDPLKKRVQQVHDELLLGLMEGKRK